jgi:hypothetical protein
MSRRGEIGTALAWFGFGAVVCVASWRMDRLGHQGINPWSAPGLTPGAIGLLIMAFALALGWQAWRAAPGDGAEAVGMAPDEGSAADAPPPAGSAARTLLAGALCVLFAGISLGRGVPFVVEGAVFILAFTAVFSWPTWRAENRIGRGLAQTALIAVVSAVLISWLFEQVFLVRLP